MSWEISNLTCASSRSKLLNTGHVTRTAEDVERNSTILHDVESADSPRLSEEQEIIQLPSQLGYQVNRNDLDQPHVVNEVRHSYCLQMVD